MNGRFDGKSVLVTGGNSGLGFGTAKYFAEQGATVFIAGRRKEELDTAQAELGNTVTAIECDITIAEDLDRLFATISKAVPKLDIVVANAGAAIYARIGEYTHDALDATFGLNLKGTAFTVQGALPLMPDGGSIVLMSSIEGGRGAESLGIYAATKAALQSFARTWANELKDRKIRVNAISPGMIYTPAYTNAGVTLESLDPVLPTIPAGRLGTAEEIGKAIAFLASDDSAYVNGFNLVVDGGQTEVI